MSEHVGLNQVGVVILNWNGPQSTTRCLESLEPVSNQLGQILVIDNGSNPSQVESLQKVPGSPLRVIRSEMNRGFAGGMNLGIQELLQFSELHFFLLLNNDTQVQSDSISLMQEYMYNHPQVGLVGPRMMSMNVPERLDNRGVGLSSWGLAWNVTDAQTVPSLMSGGCLLIRRQVVEDLQSQTGMIFDERFFLYMEDVDLGLRAVSLGWQHHLQDLALVKHIGGESSRRAPDIPLYYWHRNSVWVVIKNFPSVCLWWASIPFLLLHLGIGVVYAVRGRGRVVWKAKWEALKGLPSIWKTRQYQPRLKRKEFHSILLSNWVGVRAWFVQRQSN